MKYTLIFVLLFLQLSFTSKAQSFNYSVELNPVQVPDLPGLHSFAFAQHNNYWLIIGGRKDGMHARQPFASFPLASNNTDIYVVDIQTKQVWSKSLNTLPTGIKEQLQSTNMNFFQDEDTLYLIGGYAYSATAADHITFDNLTSIFVPDLITAIITSNPISGYFKQISATIFDITGGQLGKVGDEFYLVGGQKFEGRYNPMGFNTYVQTYSNQIRKFKINNSGSQLSYSNYSALTDTIHLHRRDYNLLPQIYPDGTFGYMISSGVFQKNVDLPYLYPVDIKSNGITPQLYFNQFLSNYHSAKVALYDSVQNQMHNLFFGGMSQYYYQNGNQVMDNSVPFVKTISRVTRNSDGSLYEFKLDTEMPGLKGAGAEFFTNRSLATSNGEIVRSDLFSSDTVSIGHIVGGISSTSLNPFTNNQTSTTSAESTIYEVRLVKKIVGIENLQKDSKMEFNCYPNPANDQLTLDFNILPNTHVQYLLTSVQGQILQQGEFAQLQAGINSKHITLDERIASQIIMVSIIVDGQVYSSRKVVKL